MAGGAPPPDRDQGRRRAATVCVQAKPVLRWFRDDASLRQLAGEARLPIHRLPLPARGDRGDRRTSSWLAGSAGAGPQLGWSHVSLDGTLIEINRVAARNEHGHHEWYSGKHKTQGGNVQIVADPTGFPMWSAPVEPGSVHDITAARTHCRGALYAAAAADCPPWPTRATPAPESVSTPRSKAATSPSTTPATTCC